MSSIKITPINADFYGTMNVGTIGQAAASVTLRFQKPHTKPLDFPVTSGGGGEIAITTTEETPYFSQFGGRYTITVLDASQKVEPLTLTGESTAYDCLQMEFAAATCPSGAQTITLTEREAVCEECGAS